MNQHLAAALWAFAIALVLGIVSPAGSIGWLGVILWTVTGCVKLLMWRSDR